MAEAAAIDYGKLTEKEILFVDDYLKFYDKNRAAMAAGYAKVYARQRGYEMYHRPHIKDLITREVRKRTLTDDELLKIISDISQCNVGDYYRPVKKYKISNNKISLGEYIERREEFLYQRREFGWRAQLDEKRLSQLQVEILFIKEEILQLKIEWERNPEAYRYVKEEGEVTVMELDMKLLIKDKEKARIKRVKINKDGSHEVELQDSGAAHERLLKIKGMFSVDNEQRKNVNSVDLSKLPEEMLKTLLANAK